MTANARLVWLLMLGVAVVGSNSLALSPILSDVAADLGATPVAVARANAAYGGATALSALLLGSLVDRFGPERVLVAGLGALAVAMLASAAATHWVWLALAQAGAGAAAGVILPATYALATAAAPPGRGAETLGRVLTGWSLSLVAGVPLSAAIASSWSWRASYAALAVLLVLAAGLLSRQAVGARPGPGSAATMREAWRRPGVRALLAVCLLFMTGFYGVYAYLGDHVRAHLGLSATEAGLMVFAYGAGFGVATLADRVIDRIGAARLFPAVLAVVAVIYAAMSSAMTTFAAVLVLSALWGFANHFGLNILVLRLTRAGGEAKGAVLALNSATTYAGALLGAWLFGLVYEGVGFAMVAGAGAGCTALAAAFAALSASGRRSGAARDQVMSAPASARAGSGGR